MKRILCGLGVGLALGSAGVAIASSQDAWRRNGVTCTTTGSGPSRGVVCNLLNSRKLVIVNQRSIIVGSGNKVIYLTSSR